MPHISTHQASPRPMPARPNIEYLKNEAKRRLAAQRVGQLGLKLSTVQFDIAREYGFTSWRALKTALEQPSAVAMEAAGDWIGQMPQGMRLALHVGPDGAVMDSPDYGAFGFGVHEFEARGGRMTFSLPRVNAAFHGAWDEAAGGWRGLWRQDGLDQPFVFTRGLFPPAPAVEGLDGIWEGLFDDQLARLVLRVVTDRHGTFVTCDSPDRSGYNLPVQAVGLQDGTVTFRMKTVVVTGTLDTDADAIAAVLTRDDQVYSITLRRRLPGEAPLELPIVELPGDMLPRYTGEFGPESWRVVVTLEKDGLTARFPNGDVVYLVPLNDCEFRFRRGVGRLIFDIEADGSVSGLVFRLRGRDSPGKRYK